jgi:flagellar assembly protein FliH
LSKVIKQFDPASHGPGARPFDMAEIGQEGRRIISTAQETARQILVNAAKEVEERKKEAYRKGLAEALAEARDRHERAIAEEVRRERFSEVDALVKALRDVIAQIDGERDRLVRDSKSQLVTLAVRIAEAVIKREVRGSDDVARLNLEKAIQLSARHSSLTVRVSESDMTTLNRVLGDNPAFNSGDSSVELVPSAEIMPGGCLVQSTSGEVDARIETQLREIEKTLIGEEEHVR